MGDDVGGAVPQKFCPRFGMLAIEMGFVTVEQVREGMAEQVDDDLTNNPTGCSGQFSLIRGG